jgi:hypothetical protein
MTHTKPSTTPSKKRLLQPHPRSHNPHSQIYEHSFSQTSHLSPERPFHSTHLTPEQPHLRNRHAIDRPAPAIESDKRLLRALWWCSHDSSYADLVLLHAGCSLRCAMGGKIRHVVCLLAVCSLHWHSHFLAVPASPAYLSKAIADFLQVARRRLITPHSQGKLDGESGGESVRSSRRYGQVGFVGSACAEIGIRHFFFFFCACYLLCVYNCSLMMVQSIPCTNTERYPSCVLKKTIK